VSVVPFCRPADLETCPDCRGCDGELGLGHVVVGYCDAHRKQWVIRIEAKHTDPAETMARLRGYAWVWGPQRMQQREAK
jgi:hypothetical protein